MRAKFAAAEITSYWVDRQVVGRDFVCLLIELAS